MLSPEVRGLEATGARVRVSTVVQSDIAPYRLAVEMSRERLARWNPVDPDDLARHLAAQSATHRTFVVHALEPVGQHDIVGKVNVTNIARGRFQNATIGYDSYDPYAGRGLFGEGLRLVVGLAFTAEPRGLGLHRVNANVQPGNTSSAGALRSLGFRREGRAAAMLWLSDDTGATAWRDHDEHAVTADEWPAPAYQPHQHARVVTIVNGPSSAGRTTVTRALSQELGVPVLSKDLVKDDETLWSLLADSPTGAVIEASFAREAQAFVRTGLERAGIRAERVPQVWCEAPSLAAPNQPLELGPLLRVDTSAPWTPRAVTALALQIRAIIH
ncbi:GNAT family N-acetyltransferase [Luteipulveratus mongoliensis]|uniref:GNAT family N-acetyltransferase n=1 Tax=Luteipulveratus mongoliensis TaxID=571913 RepID=UPI001C54DF2E|nr:GNAT family N-acetyltransferase [Luteipulveratus mongoliensis]